MEDLLEQPMYVEESIDTDKRLVKRSKKKNLLECLERLMLSATCKALQEKRINKNPFAQNDLDDILQDISLVFDFLRENNQKTKEAIKEKISEVNEIMRRICKLGYDQVTKEIY